MLVIFGYAIVLGVRQNKIAHVGSLISLLVFASMSYPFNILPFLIVLVWLISVCVSNYKNCISQTRLTLVLLCASSIITSYCIINRYPTYDAYRSWKDVKPLYSSTMYEEAVVEYEKLFPYLKDQAAFLFEYAQSLSKTSSYEKSNDILEKATQISCDPMFYNIMGKNFQAMKQYENAEKSFLRASYIVPSRLYPHYLLFLLYCEIGDKLKAKQTAEYIYHKEIKVDSPAVQEIKQKVKKILDQ